MQVHEDVVHQLRELLGPLMLALPQVVAMLSPAGAVELLLGVAVGCGLENGLMIADIRQIMISGLDASAMQEQSLKPDAKA